MAGLHQVAERLAVESLSPEEIFDILKNRQGWFSGNYDGEVTICYLRAENPQEEAVRLAREAQALKERQERLAREATTRGEHGRAKGEWRKWRESHPAWPEYRKLCRFNHTTGPMSLEDTLRFKELQELFVSQTSLNNMKRFIGVDPDAMKQFL